MSDKSLSIDLGVSEVVKEVKEQIESMLSDNITDIICTKQKNS